MIVVMSAQAWAGPVEALNIFSLPLGWAGPSEDQALLAHKYGKVATCKSCEQSAAKPVKMTKSGKSMFPSQRWRSTQEGHIFSIRFVTKQDLFVLGGSWAWVYALKVTY